MHQAGHTIDDMAPSQPTFAFYSSIYSRVTSIRSENANIAIVIDV